MSNDTELRGKAFDFFMGVMVGIVGNFFVSSLIEMVKSLPSKDSAVFTAYWAGIFIASSILTFQFSKYTLKRLKVTPKRLLCYFDVGTLILVGLGIFVMLFALSR